MKYTAQAILLLLTSKLLLVSFMGSAVLGFSARRGGSLLLKTASLSSSGSIGVAFVRNSDTKEATSRSVKRMGAAMSQLRMKSSLNNVSAEEFTKAEIASNKVLVFSKSYCPYCSATKALFSSLGVQATVYELDNMGKDGADIQNVLEELTGQRSVPNVFINGKHIGGNDKTQAANSNGTLKKMLLEVGALPI